MQPLSHLLQSAGQADQAAIVAAAVVDQTNQILQNKLAISPELGRATTYTNGMVTIEVTHGAVAARLQNVADQARALLNQALRQRFPAQRLTIVRLRIRTI